MTPEKIKSIRGVLTQKEFTDSLNELSERIFPDSNKISLRTIESWEAGKRQPDNWGAYLLFIYKTF